MKPIALLLLVPLVGCAPIWSRHEPPGPEHVAVVDVANRLFTAMETRDTATIRALFLPDAPIISIEREGTETNVHRSSVAEFIPRIAAAPAVLRERMNSPLVHFDGELATITAAYDFYLDDRFSHCGTDVFQVTRADGTWRIAALSYTVQVEGCSTRTVRFSAGPPRRPVRAGAVPATIPRTTAPPAA